MHIIRAGFGYNANDSAAAAAVLCGVIAFKNAELGYPVRIWIVNQPIAKQIIVDSAIEEISHGIAAIAGYGKSLASTTVAWIGLRNSWLQQGQLHHISPIKRQVHYGSVRD